jgi:hypothetical protein
LVNFADRKFFTPPYDDHVLPVDQSGMRAFLFARENETLSREWVGGMIRIHHLSTLGVSNSTTPALAIPASSFLVELDMHGNRYANHAWPRRFTSPTERSPRLVKIARDQTLAGTLPYRTWDALEVIINQRVSQFVSHFVLKLGVLSVHKQINRVRFNCYFK